MPFTSTILERPLQWAANYASRASHFPFARMRANTDAPRSYGPRGNTLLLLHYGFAIQENTHDSFDVEVTVRSDSSCFKLDCTLTRKLSLDLWMFARAAYGCSVHNADVGKELSAISAVQRLLICLRSQWPTSLSDDEILMQNEMQAPSLPLRNRFALFHRIGRKRIVGKMETAMAYLASCLNDGCHACTASDREILDSASCEGDCHIIEALGQWLTDPSHVASSHQLYSCVLYSFRKCRRSGMSEQGLCSPTAVASTLCGQALNKVSFIACGQNMSACIQEGILFTTGSSDFGKLGHSKTEFDMPHQEILFRAVPQLKQVVVVACGGNHTVCIDASASIFAWGENVYGQCGLGFTCQQITCPRPVIVTEHFDSVVCGEAVTILSNSNEVHACGCNLEGECGLGTTDASVERPTRVQLPGNGVRKVCCRWRHSIVVMNNGLVFVWGSADSHRIGVPATHRSVMAKPQSAGDGPASFIGRNAQDARDSCVNLPLLLASAGAQLPAVIDAAAGFKMSVFVTADGAVYACGAVGHNESEMPLHLVVGLPPCSRVWSGSSHGFLLANDGALLAYGKTSSGRLGCTSGAEVKFVPISEAATHFVEFPVMSRLSAVACGQAQSLFALDNRSSEVLGQRDAERSLVACGRIE